MTQLDAKLAVLHIVFLRAMIRVSHTIDIRPPLSAADHPAWPLAEMELSAEKALSAAGYDHYCNWLSYEYWQELADKQ